MADIERRILPGAVEFRAAAADAGPGLSGYAAVFGRKSQDLGGFVEVIAAGAFTKTIKEARVLCRYNHDDDGLLGTTEAGTLRLTIDKTGLAYDVDLPDTGAGRDMAVLAGRGDVRYSSFAFYCVKDEWDTSVTPALRTVLEAQLVDVAPVNSPAYLDTSVAVRSFQHATELVVPPAADERSDDDTKTPPVPEPPHPHSVPVSVQQRLAELNENK